MAIDRTALLIVRAWVEPESARTLRARIHVTDDISAGFRVVVMSEPVQVEMLVAQWLEDVVRPR